MSIDPYMAVGLSPTVWGVRERDEIEKNLDHLHDNLKAACWLSGLELPVKLAVIPEGGLQGFTDEIMDMNMKEYRDKIAVDIPGKETDRLGEYAREFGIYIVASMKEKAVNPDFDEKFYNTAFLINPEGEVILKHRKVTPLLPVERSVSPHDVWDVWVEEHGDDLDSLFEVAETEIGNIGICLAIEGAYPEYVRGLAMNGAEVVARIACPEPLVASEGWEIQNRARALDNSMYMVCPNLGTYYLTQDSETPVDTFGGGSQVIDYRGKILGDHNYGAGSSYTAGAIDVEGLRRFRTRSPLMNWIKDLRPELIEAIYDRDLYPKNLYLDEEPPDHEGYAEQVTEPQIQKMVDQGIFHLPSDEICGAEMSDGSTCRRPAEECSYHD